MPFSTLSGFEHAGVAEGEKSQKCGSEQKVETPAREKKTASDNVEENSKKALAQC